MNPDGAIAVNLASSDAPANIRRAEAIFTTMGLAFDNITTYGVAGPDWLKTKKGSVNLIFFAGKPVDGMRTPQFVDRLTRSMNRNQFPPQGLEFFLSHAPVSLGPGQILTDEFSPLDLLQGEA